MSAATLTVTAPTWRTYDPESDDALDAKFGPSLVARARKRRVIQPGNWPHNKFLVIGDGKLGDAYEDYTVTFDGRLYRCSCREHGYGEYRKLCSHALAVILYRKGHRAAASTDRGVGRVGGTTGDDGLSADAVIPAGESEGGAGVEVFDGANDAADTEPTLVLPDPTDAMFGEPKLPDWVKEIREHQWPAVVAVVEAFRRGDRVVVVDAPTGSGKTLLAELVRRVLGVRALYVCSTKSLQDQFVRDFPYARVLKGRANYPTGDHPEQFEEMDPWGRPRLTAADCTKRMVDLPACDGCPPGTREGSQGMHCVNCHPVGACPYEGAKSAALGSDLAVLNTSYFLTEVNAVGKFSADQQHPPFGLVIVDEADLLESELMGQVEVRITERMQKDLGMASPEKKTVEASWVEWVNGEAIPKVTKAMKKLSATSDDVKVVRERQKWERLLGKLRGLEAGLGDGGWVFTGYDEGEIAFKPVRVDGFGKAMLWRHGVRWLCMSATVIDPEEFVESLGLVGVGDE